MEGADGQHSLLRGSQFPGMNLLKRQQNVGRGGQGIDAVLGRRAMAALTLYPDGEIIRRRSTDTGSAHNDHTGGHGNRRCHMEHQRRIGLGVFQNTAGDHVLCALENLFRRLEHQFHRAGDFLLVGLQQFRRAQQNGRVQIVAAGMHGTVFAGKFLAGFLGNGQCIHIRPEEEYLSRLPAAHRHHKTGLAAVGRGVTHLLQLCPDIGLGLS